MNTTTAAKAPRNRVIAFYGAEGALLDQPTHAIVRKSGEGAVIVGTIAGINTEFSSSTRIAWGPIADAPDAQFCGKCGDALWYGPTGAPKDVYCRPCGNARARELQAAKKAETPDSPAARRRDPVAERMDRVIGALAEAQAKTRFDLIAATLRNIAQADDYRKGLTKALAAEAHANAFAAAARLHGLTVAEANEVAGTSVPEPTMTLALTRRPVSW